MRMCCSARRPGLGVTCATLMAKTASAQDQVCVASPDGWNEVAVEIREGKLYHSLQPDGRTVLLPSQLGFEFRGARPLRETSGDLITAETADSAEMNVNEVTERIILAAIEVHRALGLRRLVNDLP